MTHYNTTNETGSDLEKAKKDSNTQTMQVLSFLKERPGLYFTADEIAQSLDMLLTSCRRALSDAKESGSIIKSDVKREGRYGRNNYCWSYPEKTWHQHPQASTVNKKLKPAYRPQRRKGRQLSLPGFDL